MNKYNIKRLINHLKAPGTINGKPIHFNMSGFYRVEDCGTHVCIAGYAARIAAMDAGSEYTILDVENGPTELIKVAQEFLDLTPEQSYPLFYGFTRERESDPTFAIARLEFLMEHGYVPQITFDGEVY